MIEFLKNSTQKLNYTSALFLCICFASANASVNDTIPTPKPIATIKKILVQSKDTTAVKDSNKILQESVKTNYWTITNKPEIILTQTSFLNWTKGGNNTIAGILSFKGVYNYKKGLFYWKNNTHLRYGLSKEEGINSTLKTDDIIDIKSSLGYRSSISSKWYYSGEFNLTTQFAKGYKTKNQTTVISNFFAPARMRIGVGSVYTDIDDHFKLHLSPLTNQVTFVLDQELANRGAFGVTPAKKDAEGNIIKEGDNINSEIGSLIKIEYTTKLMKNVNFILKSSFYSDYINEFGNVDSDIELNLDLKVNEYIHSRISSHMLYDDDAKILQDDGSQVGPRVQLKQILGVGVTYVF